MAIFRELGAQPLSQHQEVWVGNDKRITVKIDTNNTK